MGCSPTLLSSYTLLEKLRGIKGTEWQKRGFVAVLSTEEGSQGVCMLQCSHCRELKSA